jgi:hypothetical protein
MSIYYDSNSKQFYQLDDKSVVPPNSREIEPDALEYYNSRRKILEGLLDYTEGVITLAKVKQVETDKVAPGDRRMFAYETMRFREDGTPLIAWHGDALTVDEAVRVYLNYLAEDRHDVTEVVQGLIVGAKGYIRGVV